MAKSAAGKNKSVAEKLLDAQVKFAIAQLDGDALRANIEEELDHALEAAEKITLNDSVTREQIKDTVRTYAVELDLHGAIPELVGEVARTLYAHPIHDRTTLEDLVSDEQFRDIVDQALAMKDLREKIIKRSIGNPLFAALASDVLYNGIKGYINDNPLTRNSKMASSALSIGKTLLSKASPGLEQSLEEGVKKYIKANIKSTQRQTEHFINARIEDDTVRDRAIELWDEVKTQNVAGFREYVSERDVEEGFVTGYEYWRKLRHTDYYWTIIEVGIDSFFDKYGDTSLRQLLDEVGIHREMMVDEAMRYAPPVIKMLKKKKLLEPRIRRQFEKFYLSDEVKEILGEG